MNSIYNKWYSRAIKLYQRLKRQAKIRFYENFGQKEIGQFEAMLEKEEHLSYGEKAKIMAFLEHNVPEITPY